MIVSELGRIEVDGAISVLTFLSSNFAYMIDMSTRQLSTVRISLACVASEYGVPLGILDFPYSAQFPGIVI